MRLFESVKLRMLGREAVLPVKGLLHYSENQVYIDRPLDHNRYQFYTTFGIEVVGPKEAEPLLRESAVGVLSDELYGEVRAELRKIYQELKTEISHAHPAMVRITTLERRLK